MKVLINSIALEPNRWTKDKVPYFRLEDLLEAIAGAGFGAIEVWQNHVATLGERAVCGLAEKGRKLGLTFPVIGMYPAFHLTGRERQEELARFKTMFGAARTLGAGVIKMFAGRIASADITARQWDLSVGFVRDVLRSAGEEMLFTVETHARTLADSPRSALRFIEAVGSERLKVCWQPYDFTDTEGAIRDFDALSEHVVHLHVQGRAGGEMALLEESDIDWRRVLSHIFASGFDGLLSIEFTRGSVVEPPRELSVAEVLANAARDREFIRSVPGYRE